MRPRISIVIPSYNRPHLLKRLLTSIAGQTFQAFEVVVVDDHSPQWEEIGLMIEKFRNTIQELTVIHNAGNYGAPYSRNVGILNSRADWVALVDDDDEWMPEKLEKQAALIERASSDIGLLYTWAQVMREGQVIRREESVREGAVLKDLLKENFIPSSSVIARKEALMKAGLFDEAFASCQDWDMWVRLVLCGYQVEVVKSHEMIFHHHQQESIGKSKSAERGYRQFYEKHLELYRRYDPKFYYTQRLKNWVKNLLFRWRKKPKPSSLT